MESRRMFFRIVMMVTAFALIGCNRGPRPQTLVAYVSVDQPFAEKILADFTARTGIRVDCVYDSEAGKTTGLLRRLSREASAPRCDIFWSSEVFGTIELARSGVLQPYDSPAAADIPAEWRDAGRLWTGTAARARVVAFPADRSPPSGAVASWEALAATRELPTQAVANPLFGTTRGHFAALVATWGRDRTAAYAQELRDARALLADGNAHAVRLVHGGQAALCWTDTDDVWSAQRNGAKLSLTYPTLGDRGPIWIPCTVSLVRGGPGGEDAKKLIDYLVSAAVEEALARSDSHNVPVRSELRRRLAADPDLKAYLDIEPRAMDFTAVADALPEAGEIVRETLLR